MIPFSQIVLQLLLQLQIKDHTIDSLTSENAKLSSALGVAESRLNDLYGDQSRMEDEMAARIEVAEKLREQVRELEREKRDLQRRYNEQVMATDSAREYRLYHNRRLLSKRNVRRFMIMNNTSNLASSLLHNPAKRPMWPLPFRRKNSRWSKTTTKLTVVMTHLTFRSRNFMTPKWNLPK